MIFDKQLVISLDKNTKREMIGDRLYIRDCVLTSATVNEYLGREIGDSSLEQDKAYGILRPLEELEKALKSYQGIPVLHDHENVDFTNPDKNRWMGTTGTNASIKGKDLVNDVILWDVNLINLVNSNKIKDLSVGYSHQLDSNSGMFENKKYDFVMKDLIANHLAVVDDGRVERAKLSDSNNILNEVKKTMKKSAWEHIYNFFSDKKVMDNGHYAKGIMEIANKDSGEFEGGEIEQAKAIIQMAKKIKASEEVEDSEEHEKPKKDSEEPKKPESKEDSEEEKAKKEKEEKEKKEANDKAIQDGIQKGLQERIKIEALCKKVVGNISEAVLLDSTPDELINKTLDSKKINYQNKNYDAKIAILETLALQQVAFNSPQLASDSAPVRNFINIFGK